MTGASPLWLLGALALQAAFAVNQGGFYQALLRLLDAGTSLQTAVRLALVMAFGSLASPAGTATGIAFFVAAAADVGIPASRAFWVSLAYYLFDYSSTVVVLAVGLLVLFFHHDLRVSHLIVVAVFYAAVLAAVGVVVVILAKPHLVRSVLVPLARVGHRLIRRARRQPEGDGDRAAAWAADLEEVIVALRRRPGQAIRPLLHAFSLEGLNLATLAAAFWAVGYPIHPGVLVAGYAIGVLFMIVSITPSGVGVVEGAMTVTFTSLFVPLESAVAATLLFRLFTFWLPMAVGFISMRVFPVRGAISRSRSGP